MGRRHLARELALKVLFELESDGGDVERSLKYHVAGLDQMAKVERTLLRIATFEIRYLPSVPLKAAINESIELAKTFGGPDSGKFVNGILGRIAADAEIRRPPADQAATREAS
ncbi:MAG: hypothetical protein E6J51_07500 [Chloroflexi bacterium]|nr:MAG: hypothetical protein E6J51_07500 [Chloroflexota bacterium]